MRPVAHCQPIYNLFGDKNDEVCWEGRSDGSLRPGVQREQGDDFGPVEASGVFSILCVELAQGAGQTPEGGIRVHQHPPPSTEARPV